MPTAEVTSTATAALVTNPALVELPMLGKVVLASILLTALLFFLLKILFEFRKMHYQ